MCRPATPAAAIGLLYTWSVLPAPGTPEMKIRLSAFEKVRVLVAANLMLDRYWHGATDRISPEAPVPVVPVCEGEQRPGGAGGFTLNLAVLGAVPGLVGVTGADEAGGARYVEDACTRQVTARSA